MTPNFSEMDELECPDCKTPLAFEPRKDDPNRVTFVGCRCGRKLFDLPDCFLMGPEGGPFFIYAALGSNQRIQKQPV